MYSFRGIYLKLDCEEVYRFGVELGVYRDNSKYSFFIENLKNDLYLIIVLSIYLVLYCMKLYCIVEL